MHKCPEVGCISKGSAVYPYPYQEIDEARNEPLGSGDEKPGGGPTGRLYILGRIGWGISNG
jgi:hypothetical protein